MISSTTSGSIAGRCGPNASPVTERRPSIVCRAVKNGKSVPNSSLCVDAVLDRRDERLVEQPAPARRAPRRRRRRAGGGGRRRSPRRTTGGPCARSRSAAPGSGARSRRAGSGGPAAASRRARTSCPGGSASAARAARAPRRPQELGPERVDVLVDRAELAAGEAEVALHPLELVERARGRAGRRRRSRPAAPGRARRTSAT